MVGSILEARDRNAPIAKYYKARIVEIRENKEAKIHFLGWNSRYDQWYDLFSVVDLKPCKADLKASKSAAYASSTETARFEVGAKVMAMWKLDEVFYPAHVKRVVHKENKLFYDIMFYDGVKKLVQSSSVKELSDEVAKMYPDSPDTPSISTLLLKKEEEARRAEAELLLAIQQPQLNVGSDSEAGGSRESAKPAEETILTVVATTDAVKTPKSGTSSKKKPIEKPRLKEGVVEVEASVVETESSEKPMEVTVCTVESIQSVAEVAEVKEAPLAENEIVKETEASKNDVLDETPTFEEPSKPVDVTNEHLQIKTGYYF